MLDTETYADNATASLQAGLAAALAAIDTEKGDFTLDVPLVTSYSLGTEPVLTYPWVEVAVANSDVANLDLAHEGDQTTQVIVAVRYQHPNGTRLDRALRRYARAVAEVLLADDAFGYSEVVTDIRFAFGTNPELDDRQQFTGVAVAAFAVAGIAAR